MLSIALDRHGASSRFEEVVQPTPDRWMRHLVLGEPNDVDAEVVRWLEEAVRLGTEADAAEARAWCRVLGQAPYPVSMGAWGAGPFENDDASDWAYEFDGLDEAAGLRVLAAALDAARPGEYLESQEGANAVAAAVVVAWMQDPSEVPESPDGESAATWVRQARPRATDELIASARAALDHVRSDDSELAELWAEIGDPAWRESLTAIDARLRA